MAAPLQFPSKAEIVSLFEKHSLPTQKTNPILIQKIVNIVAATFADQKMQTSSLWTSLTPLVDELNRKEDEPLSKGMIQATTNAIGGTLIFFARKCARERFVAAGGICCIVQGTILK